MPTKRHISPQDILRVEIDQDAAAGADRLKGLRLGEALMLNGRVSELAREIQYARELVTWLEEEVCARRDRFGNDIEALQALVNDAMGCVNDQGGRAAPPNRSSSSYSEF